MGRGTLAARSRGRAAGGGTAPDTRRPSQRWQANLPGDGPPPPPRHAAPTGHAGQGDSVGPPHPHTCAHSTWVADPTARPVGGQSGEGQRLTSDAPHNGGRHPPPGTPFRHPHSEQRRPPRAHAVGPVLGPHARTDRNRDTWVAEPWLPAPEDGRPGEGQRLTPDAPHNGGRPLPPGAAPHHPRAMQPPRGMQAKGTVLGPHTHTPAPAARAWRTPTARSVGRQSGEGQRLTSHAPHNGGRHPPPGTPFRHPHSEQRRPARAHAVGTVLGPHARTNRTRNTRVAEPWLPAPEDGGPGEGQRLTPDAPHNGGRPPPPGTAPPPAPRHAAPTGHATQGDSVGPPDPHIRARSTWVADPNSPPSGRAVGGGTAPDLRRPSQWWRAAPPGTPFRHPHSEQCRPARAHAVGPVLGPHARTDCTRDTRVAEPGLPAPEDGRPGEGQRLTPDAPQNGGRQSPRRRPSATSKEQRRPARAHTVGPVLGPHAGTDCTRDTRVAESRPPAPEGGRLGEGQRLTPDAPHNGGRPPPPGTAPHHPRGTQPPQGIQAKWTVLGPHTHTPATTARGRRTPTARPVGGQFGEGERLTIDAPHNAGRHPPGNALLPPPQRATPAHKGARSGAGAGSHARTDRTRDTRVAEPRLPAPEGGLPRERQRLTPDAPHNGGRPSPPGTASHHPRGMQPPQGMQAKGTVLGPHTHTPAPTACGWRTSTARPVGGQFREGERLTSDAPHNSGRHPPGNALPPPPQRVTPARQGARCGAGAGSHARTNRTRDTRVAEPRLPAPEDGGPGGDSA